MAITEDPRTAPPLRWGIIGAGGIAVQFTHAVNTYTRSHIAAIGSRSYEKAETFATRNGIPTTHASYQELVDDPQVEAVYVATPHSEHKEHALLAIRAGKHVLVEKAFTRNESEAREVFDAAREAGVFVMEAMWTRHLPHVAAIRTLIEDGVIGDVISLEANHGQQFSDFPLSHRLHNPDLAGGALLDLGVYPVSYTHDVLGVPDQIVAVGQLTSTGVDGHVSMIFRYGDRTMAELATTLWAKTKTGAVISGTLGRIESRGHFYRPSGFDVFLDDGTQMTYDREVDNGFQYQAAEVARCVAAGLTESPRMTWQGTLDVMHSMDEVRRQIGLVYPGE